MNAPAPSVVSWTWLGDLTRLQMDFALQAGQAAWGNMGAAQRAWQDAAMAALKMQSAVLAACFGKAMDPEAVLAGAAVLE